MIEFDNIEIRSLPLSLQSCTQEIDSFLANFNLKRDRLDYYVGLFLDDKMIGGGGCDGDVIKCVAVDPLFREYGLTNKLISHLRSYLRQLGFSNIFVFTKPENRQIFESLSFSLIAQSEKAILLESSANGISNFCRNLSSFGQNSGVIGSIVMNANPFTLGHLFLVEQATNMCDHLHIFVVNEDRSIFPSDVRLSLVKQGVAHLKNVTVHSGEKYIISSATFPTYFLKSEDEMLSSYTHIDLQIFGKYIAPALSISKRFVGDEPLDRLTSQYNEAMQKYLPSFSVEPVIIPRTERNGQVISASMIRKLISQGDISKTRTYLPDSTFDYLNSQSCSAIIENLQHKFSLGEKL